MIVERRQAERVLWAWFNPKSLIWMRVYKMRVQGMNPYPWLLTRGNKGSIGYKPKYFTTLGDLIGDLKDHEMDALIDKLDVPAMMLIAMAADEGEAA